LYCPPPKKNGQKNGQNVVLSPGNEHLVSFWRSPPYLFGIPGDNVIVEICRHRQRDSEKMMSPGGNIGMSAVFHSAPQRLVCFEGHKHPQLLPVLASYALARRWIWDPTLVVIERKVRDSGEGSYTLVCGGCVKNTFLEETPAPFSPSGLCFVFDGVPPTSLFSPGTTFYWNKRKLAPGDVDRRYCGICLIDAIYGRFSRWKFGRLYVSNFLFCNSERVSGIRTRRQSKNTNAMVK